MRVFRGDGSAARYIAVQAEWWPAIPYWPDRGHAQNPGTNEGGHTSNDDQNVNL
jgi:hypothetical protein